jgi:hypothetical protein
MTSFVQLFLAPGGYTYVGDVSGSGTVPALTAGTIDQTSPTVGTTLTVSGSNADSYATFQWNRNGSPIGGATSATYTLVSADASASITRTVSLGDKQTPATTSAVTVGGSTLPLDSLTGVQFALSAARRLLTSYTGPLIRVRRSSDNTEQDIGYDGAGLLDTTALLSFVGSGDGFVRTIYEQSNSRNFVMTTQANQPRIVSAGAVDTFFGRPAMVFDGTNDRIEWAPSSTTLTVNTVNAVCRRTSGPTGGGRLFQLANQGGGDGVSVGYIASGGGFGRFAGKGSGGAGSGSFTADTLQIITAVGVDAGNARYFVNGTLNNAGTSWPTGSTTTGTDGARIGAATGSPGTFWSGPISELTAFSGSLSTADRAALEANQAAFYV